MKCESCGNEMIGAAIICRACNHNNALTKKLALRRQESPHNQSSLSRASGPSTELPTIVQRKDNEVNLLHFPSSLNNRAEAAPARQAQAPPAESRSQTETYPAWRAELKERVRRIMEKRATNEIATPNPPPVQSSRAQTGDIKLGRNPIVEAALKRIRWSSRDKEGRSDGGTERLRDREKEGLSVSQSLHHSAPSSLRLSVLPSRPSRPSLPSRPSRPSRLSSQNSPGKASADRPLAGAPNKQVDTQFKTRIAEITHVHEPLALKADPAPLHARLLAGACDFEIVFVAFLLIFGAFEMSNNASSLVDGPRLLIGLLLSAVVFTYQIVMLAFAGRTFGMAMLKLNLVNTGDESLPVTLWQKLLRASAATIVFICFPLYLTAWFSVSRRTLPDLVSGTTVS
jgi:uncharacterized RDD family membrane protein YckC